jgi:hypothetical protein
MGQIWYYTLICITAFNKQLHMQWTYYVTVELVVLQKNLVYNLYLILDMWNKFQNLYP